MILGNTKTGNNLEDKVSSREVRVTTGLFTTIDEYMKDLTFRMGIESSSVSYVDTELKFVAIDCNRLTHLDSESLYTILEDDVVKLERIYVEQKTDQSGTTCGTMIILCSYNPEFFKKEIQEEQR